MVEHVGIHVRTWVGAQATHETHGLFIIELLGLGLIVGGLCDRAGMFGLLNQDRI